MKRILTMTVVCLSLAHLSFSQEYFTKGSNILTGGINLSFDENDTKDEFREYNNTNKNYGFLGEYSRFIKDNLALGLRIGYDRYDRMSTRYSINEDYLNTEERIGNGFNVGLLARKFYPVNQKFGAYISSSLSYSQRTTKYEHTYDGLIEPTHSEEKLKSGGIYAGLGIYYFILKRISLSIYLGEIGLSYQTTKLENSGDNTVSQESTRKGFNIDLSSVITFDQTIRISYFF